MRWILITNNKWILENFSMKINILIFLTVLKINLDNHLMKNNEVSKK